jgi:DNA-3-methyladenine glycosylase
MSALPRSFFARNTADVARDLLGCLLVRGELAGRIVETEAYLGPEDSASHARSGQTRRNSVMFGGVGHAYVYFTYGMHWMLNAVAHRNQAAGGVLLRAVEPVRGLQTMCERRGGRGGRELTNGPAKLCQAFDVTGDLNAVDLCDSDGPLYIAAGEAVPAECIESGPRIGVDYASETWRERSMRFWINGNRYVSR